MKNIKKIVINSLLALFTIAFFTGATVNATQGFRVTIVDGEEIRDVQVLGGTVSELLIREGIDLNAFDRLNFSTRAALTAGMRIEISRFINISLSIDSVESIRLVPAGYTVLDLVWDLNNELGTEFIIPYELTMPLKPNMTIQLQTISFEHNLSIIELPFDRIYVETDELYLNEQAIYQEGAVGVREVSSFSHIISGEETSVSVLSDRIISTPVTEIVHVGTALPSNMAVAGNGEVFTFSRFMIMEATAYTLSFECTGRHPGDPNFGRTASGMMARVGVVAVDTNVIPFHTRLYIEGYGFAVAGDRGGAIRGERIDLFFDTREEAIQFGRRNIRVWVLED